MFDCRQEPCILLVTCFFVRFAKKSSRGISQEKMSGATKVTTSSEAAKISQKACYASSPGNAFQLHCLCGNKQHKKSDKTQRLNNLLQQNITAFTHKHLKVHDTALFRVCNLAPILNYFSRFSRGDEYCIQS
jgi:hypothetical protein